MNTGWIKIHRKLADWGWASDPYMMSLFVHLLLGARIDDGEYRGRKIKRGQLVFGRREWSEKTGISERSIRTCLQRLKEGGEITSKATNRFSILTIVKYEEYQKNGEQLTSNQPAANQQNLGKTQKMAKNQPANQPTTDPPQGRESLGIAEGIGLKTNQLTNQQLTSNQPAANHIHKKERIKEGKNISPPISPPIVPPFPPLSVVGERKKNNEGKNELFEEFWSGYGLKMDKLNAKRAWEKAVAKKNPEVIIRKAKEYHAFCQKSKTKQKYPQGWLSGECWENDYQQASREIRQERKINALHSSFAKQDYDAGTEGFEVIG